MDKKNMKQDMPTRHLTVKGKKREVEEKSRKEGESDRCHSMTMLDLPIALKRQKSFSAKISSTVYAIEPKKSMYPDECC